MRGIYHSKNQSLKALVFSLLSSVALLGKTVVPMPEEVELLTGGAENGLLRLLAKVRLALPDSGILGLIVILGLYGLYKYYFGRLKKSEAAQSKVFFIVALFFALTTEIGRSINQFDSLEFMLGSKFQLVYSLMQIAGLTMLFFTAINVGVHYYEQRKSILPAASKIGTILLDAHPIAVPFCFLLLCWLPYWIPFFPGSIVTDMVNQLKQYFALSEWSSAHPILGTLVYGKLMQIGQELWNDNFGVFLCALFQNLLFASSVTCALYYMRKWEIRQNVRLIGLLFWGLCPLLPFWIHNVMKDSTYFCLLLVFGVLQADIVLKTKKGENIGKTLIAAVAFGSLASLIRNNGIYVVVPAILCVGIIAKNHRTRRMIMGSTAMLIIIFSLVSGIFQVVFDAEEGSAKEVLSIPFQQTARYVKYYKDELTEEEYAAINGVLDCDTIGEEYDSDLSDSVKKTYKGDESQLPRYFKAWLKMFFKHPIVYIEATLSNTCGYFCPNWEMEGAPVHYGITRKAKGIFEFHFVLPWAALRNACVNWLFICKQVPGVGLLFHAGTYTWGLLLLIALALYKGSTPILVGEC